MGLYHSWKWSMVSDYHTIAITGGEPMLYPQQLIAWIKRYRALEDYFDLDRTNLILYTAFTKDRDMLFKVLELVDSMTITLHNQDDVSPFEVFNMKLENTGPYDKSLRLSIFGDLVMHNKPLPLWNTMKNRVALDQCPVPEDDMLVLRDNFER
jgi:hypothetical protein